MCWGNTSTRVPVCNFSLAVSYRPAVYRLASLVWQYFMWRYRLAVSFGNIGRHCCLAVSLGLAVGHDRSAPCILGFWQYRLAWPRDTRCIYKYFWQYRLISGSCTKRPMWVYRYRSSRTFHPVRLVFYSVPACLPPKNRYNQCFPV